MQNLVRKTQSFTEYHISENYKKYYFPFSQRMWQPQATFSIYSWISSKSIDLGEFFVSTTVKPSSGPSCMRKLDFLTKYHGFFRYVCADLF